MADPLSAAVVGMIGWIAYLAKNYYSEMTKLAIDGSKQNLKNEQERVKREREQFDIIFQNLLTRVNEERDVIQSLIQELRGIIERSAEVDKEVLIELAKIRRDRQSYLPTKNMNIT